MFEQYSIWDKLTRTTKPIFMYGTGNGGDKIIAALDSYGIQLRGIFASDGFVRDRYFHGFKVRSYSDVVAEYGNDIVVLLAFGTTLPDVTKFIYELNARHELIIPDVPLYGGGLFDYKYFTENLSLIHSAREIFSDELSKNIFDDAINFRLTGKIEYLENTSDSVSILREIFSGHTIETILDGGAFKGDSCQDFITALHPKAVIAVEADLKTNAKLSLYANEEKRAVVSAVHAALWETDGELSYISSGSRGSGKSGQNKRAEELTVPSLTVDTICRDISVDLIKLDIEGAELSAIRGAKNTIERDKPSLAVSLYHRTEDIFTLPLLIHEYLPTHSFYLRRVPCIPMWDLTLYAVKNK